MYLPRNLSHQVYVTAPLSACCHSADDYGIRGNMTKYVATVCSVCHPPRLPSHLYEPGVKSYPVSAPGTSLIMVITLCLVLC